MYVWMCTSSSMRTYKLMVLPCTSNELHFQSEGGTLTLKYLIVLQNEIISMIGWGNSVLNIFFMCFSRWFLQRVHQGPLHGLVPDGGIDCRGRLPTDGWMVPHPGLFFLKSWVKTLQVLTRQMFKTSTSKLLMCETSSLSVTSAVWVNTDVCISPELEHAESLLATVGKSIASWVLKKYVCRIVLIYLTFKSI